MQFLKEWAIALLTLGCILCIFLGYFWRMHHETKNFEKKKVEIVKHFLLEVSEPNTPEATNFHGWIIIKRADGSFIVRR